MSAARVLVVDDNRDLANGIAMLLGEAGMQVQSAYSGKAAVALLEKQEFDLVLTDVRMPSMSGLDLLEVIRARWPLTKVVLLTAYGSVDSAVAALRNGACDYLTKPFDNAELLRVVERALSQGSVSGGFDMAAVVGNVAAAVAAEDLLPGLKAALDVLLEATGADDGEIFLCEPEGCDPLLCVWAGPDGEALANHPRFEPGVGYPGIVTTTGKPLVSKGSLPQDARYIRSAVIAAGVRSMVAVPLPDVRGTLGSLHLLSRRGDFPVERVRELLERAAVPIGSAVRAALAALRQSVDALCGNLDNPARAMRSVLEAMRRVAGAQNGTLALLDPSTGRPNLVVSTGPASLLCTHAESGAWANCANAIQAHGFIADPGRREWPECCRHGLPRRASSPCCVPLVTRGYLHGLVILDLGRERTGHAMGRLVPLLSMANQLAIQLQSHHEGRLVGADSGEDVREGAGETPSAELELRCLGPFTVIRRGQVIPAESFSRSKAIVLLKLLALKGGKPVHREVLIEYLWPEVDPRQGINRLHGVLHDLRSVIEPNRGERDWAYVRNRGELYYLDVEAPIEIDLVRFRRLATDCLRRDARPDGVACLEHLVELYRGDLFEDDPYAEWCQTERDELREIAVEALRRLADLYERGARGEEAVGCLRRAARLSPFRDDLIQAQVELLMRLGRSNEAIADYEEYQRRLALEFSTEPGAELQALRQRLLQPARRGA